jgi:chromosome segregation ATPase
MDIDLLDQLASRIDFLVSDRARLKEELDRIQFEGLNRTRELEEELTLVRSEYDATRADLEQARTEIQERDSRLQAATSKVQGLLERLMQA